MGRRDEPPDQDLGGNLILGTSRSSERDAKPPAAGQDRNARSIQRGNNRDRILVLDQLVVLHCVPPPGFRPRVAAGTGCGRERRVETTAWHGTVGSQSDRPDPIT